MRGTRWLVLVAAVALLGIANSAPRAAEPEGLGWPAVTRESKPWTRWWWPGSAVDKASLTSQLEKLAAAGIGGVEITPIYGAKGYEDRYIDFLSPKWMEMLEHTCKEAKRLDLGVDMATGTGWPFGGPWIDAAHGSQKAVLKGDAIRWEPTGMKVKRAAPGDEGLVIDPFSPEALKMYLAPFDAAFAKVDLPAGSIRSQFHDSFEYYGSSWTPAFAAEFEKMHGYDVQKYAKDLMPARGERSSLDRETLARIKCDYRDTLAKLHLDYLHTWVEWSHAHGWLVRNQSHGAPGNLLDLYANADIAETEDFGSTPFPIRGLRRLDDEVRHDQDLPEPLVMRMASSASHVAGHNLTSSETLTWLREHWKESPSYTKPEVDNLLTNGINHIIYQGTVFSPDDAPWPGWLFYASTQINPANPLWEDFGALNQYITRVQSVLQSGKPDSDILLYWPVEDIWDNADGLMTQLAVHNVKWMVDQPAGKLAKKLMEKGYSFDYISDAQLQTTRNWAPPLGSSVHSDDVMTAGGTEYRVIVVPATRRMPAATLQQLVKLAKGGAKIVFEKLPEDVPGYGRLEERRATFKSALAEVAPGAVKEDVLAVLEELRVPREPIAESGISFIRRASNGGPHYYFFANNTGKDFDGWVTLGKSQMSVPVIIDPLTGTRGLAATRPGKDGTKEIRLQLASGASLIVSTLNGFFPPIQRNLEASNLKARWRYVKPAGEPVTIEGSWKIEFLRGGPELPPAIETKELKSWTDLGGDEAKRFGGTARYSIEFEIEAPGAKADEWVLDLGDVRETARVRLNGKDVTTAWSLPFRVRVGEFLKSGKNLLELDVTNLAANRIRDMDQRKVPWKIMREINFVNINYKPFDASGWGLQPSGLLGPVRLLPMKSSLEP